MAPTDYDGASVSAEKDCQKCRSRRILCDRTLPTCRKCASRGLQCPAYGLTLRWGQGVASRGRLAGKQLPVRGSDDGNPNRPRTPLSLATIPSPLGISGQAVNHLILNLMHHYQQNVAGKLAWVDGPNNPWRQVIIPLVWASPTIFYTVLSLSSEDLARRYDDNHRQRLELQDVSLRFRNNALSLLAAQIGSIRANQPLQFSNEIVSEARNALASTLILYNVELLGAEAIKWRMHLQGARVIHQWLEHSTSYPASFDNIDKFLLYEHYYSSVFAGLTTFGMVNAPTGDNLQNMGDIAVFGEFVRVIQLVTELERSKYVHGLVINPSEFPNIIGTVETAKDKMILYSQKSHFWNDQVQRDFQHLVFIFYHASLIYTHRALSEDPSTNEYIQVSRDSILDWINLLSDRSTFAHDLVWPLFILGTESKGRPELQNFVSREMEAVMKISGVLDRRKVLSFLQLYWSTDLQHSVTWIQFMREKVPENSMLIL